MSACSSCSAPIRWAVTEADRRIPLDPVPVPDGNIVFVDELAGAEALAVRYVSKARPAPDGADRFVSHFVTCPNAAQHRKKAR